MCYSTPSLCLKPSVKSVSHKQLSPGKVYEQVLPASKLPFVISANNYFSTVLFLFWHIYNLCIKMWMTKQKSVENASPCVCKCYNWQTKQINHRVNDTHCIVLRLEEQIYQIWAKTTLTDSLHQTKQKSYIFNSVFLKAFLFRKCK